MKAVSLWEPWATGMALGLKANETRHWWTSYRGRLAIHAAKTEDHYQWIFMPPADDEHEDITTARKAFAEAGVRDRSGLSFGCIVAFGTLKDCVRVELIRPALSPVERALGNYSDGRFAWIFTDIERLPVPLPARGAQGFWDWDNGEPPAASPQMTLAI